ncbi:hypothetical protein O181_039944 [Austropuccinia psidii MF-1]|uniref:Uncharacterized protein n=1 Tax=Austropuccinia psidii MF-1 TaxID=1389203 RepID=A0A9Q3HF09_9BASI|nr:hypothetical protein [Austropuccinia psidii MF-1]
MITRFCAYGLECKDSDGFTHDCCTLIPDLELAYRKSVHYSTGKTPALLEKGWNLRLPADTLRKYLIDIHLTSSSFNIMLYKVKHNAKICLTYAFKYSKQKWEKSNKLPHFKVGHLVLVSTLNSNDIKVLKKLKTCYCFLTLNQCSSSGIKWNPTPLVVPPEEPNEFKNIKEFIKER